MPVQLSPGDLVQVTNLGSQPFTVTYNSKNYKLSPGKQSFIPVEAAILWFGDPRSAEGVQSYKDETGSPVFVPDRQSEVRRLSVKYGHQSGNVVDYLTGKTGETLVPTVKVYTLDGEQIPTVLDDPEGDQVIAANTTVAEKSNLESIVEAQQKQINFLLGKLGLSGGDPTSTAVFTETGELPEDQSHLQGGPGPSTEPDLPADLGGPGSLDLNNLP